MVHVMIGEAQHFSRQDRLPLRYDVWNVRWEPYIDEVVLDNYPLGEGFCDG